MRRRTRLTLPWVTSLILVAALLLTISPAWAQGESPCSASINGEPVHGRTIKVDPNSPATLTVAAPSGPTQNSVYVELFGTLWQIASVPAAGGEWSGTVRVQDYVGWGVGLYKVVWESRTPQGQLVCKASTSVHIPGFPLSTATGLAGAASAIIGLTGLALSLKATVNEGGRWVLKIVAKGEVKRGQEQRRLILKPTISVSQTLLGTLWGLLLSGGTLATLQQAALTLPTVELALQLTVPFTALSLMASWFRLVRES